MPPFKRQLVYNIKRLMYIGENKRVIYIIYHVGNAILIIYMRTLADKIMMIYTTFKHFSHNDIFLRVDIHTYLLISISPSYRTIPPCTRLV